MRGTEALFGLAVLGVCAMTAAVGQEERPVLTNTDIVALTETGLSPAMILTLIEDVNGDPDDPCGGAV